MGAVQAALNTEEKEILLIAQRIHGLEEDAIAGRIVGTLLEGSAGGADHEDGQGGIADVAAAMLVAKVQK